MVVDCPWKGVAAADDHHYALGVAGRDGPDRVRGAIACAYSLIAGQGRTMRVGIGYRSVQTAASSVSSEQHTICSRSIDSDVFEAMKACLIRKWLA